MLACTGWGILETVHAMSDGSTSLPQRTERREIAVERRFRVDAVFVDENARLKEWLAQRANEELGALGANAYLHTPRILAQAPTIVEEVSLVFGSSGDQRIIPALLNDARSGTLQTHVPGRSMIVVATALLVIALVGEVVVGVLQVMFADAGMAVVLQAVLLGLAAMLAGLGLGGLLTSSLARSLPAAWKAMPPDLGRARHVVQLTIGLVAVGALVTVRCYGLEAEERLVVATLTSFLSLLVVTFEAMRSYYHGKYHSLWQRMFNAQVWEANERHRAARDFYESHYRAQVQALAEGKGTIRGTGNLVAAE